MAGRGRGAKRGGPGLTFSLETIGLNRGDVLPSATLQPPPLYPDLETKIIPQKLNEVDKYLVSLKQEFHSAMSSSIYFINPVKAKPKLVRYSDKYENISNKNSMTSDSIDWKLFPTELQFGMENKKEKTSKTKLVVDIEEKLKNMEDKDEESEKEEDKEEGERDDQEEDDENVEEDIEEGTDYTQLYFDNGEKYLDDSDDNLDEGPIY